MLLRTAAAADSVQVSASGSVVRSEVVGSIRLKVFLSGMPELRLGLNDRVLFERLSTAAKPLIWIESVIERFSHSRLEILVKVSVGRGSSAWGRGVGRSWRGEVVL